jgi:enoyl-CoA hydratase/carnithine racemase
MAIGSEHLLFEQDGHVATVTLNRPEAKNALSLEMIVGLVDAWDEIDGNPDIRVAILTGAGGTFCAGADLKSMNSNVGQSDTEKRFRDDAGMAWKALLRHHQLTKPLIAAVEGFAVAGGTEILQATDIRVAGEGAKFGVTEVRRGLFPLGGSTVRLRRQIAYTKAAELLLTGETISAQEALDIGLIGHVVADGAALTKARSIADAIAANAPLSVQAVLRSLKATEGLPEAEALKIEMEIGLPVFGTEDAREGTLAFKEKRAANYQGK